jgi:hypothetical protein
MPFSPYKYNDTIAKMGMMFDVDGAMQNVARMHMPMYVFEVKVIIL